MSQALAADPTICFNSTTSDADPCEQELTKALRTWMILRRRSRPDETITRQLAKLEGRIEELQSRLGQS